MAILSSANFLVLSLLLCSSIAAYGVDLPKAPAPKRHPLPPTSAPIPAPAKPPTPPPAKTPTPPPAKPPTPPPARPPVKPPTYPPVKPPSYPLPRKKVAVQGVVFCKSCKFRANDTILGVGATPVLGAVVKLQCNNTKQVLEEKKKTDKNGYFLFTPLKVTTTGYHKCKVFLVSSPLPKCSVPTNFRSGVAGAMLIPAPFNKTLPYQYYNVGPFAFAPHKKLPCPY